MPTNNLVSLPNLSKVIYTKKKEVPNSALDTMTITASRPDFLKLTEVIPKAILHSKRLMSNLEALKTKIAIQNVMLQKETNKLMVNTDTLSVLLKKLPEIYREDSLQL